MSVFLHITVWDSCFSLSTRRSFLLPPSAFRLVLASHISHTNSSHSTQLTHQLTPHMVLTPTHHTALSSHHTHHTHLTPHMALTPTHHTCQAKCGGAVHRASWRSCCARGQAPYTEPPGGAAARVVTVGPRLVAVWQVQYTEPPGGAAARVGVLRGRRGTWLHPRCKRVHLS